MALRVSLIGSTTAVGAPTFRDSELQAFERYFMSPGVLVRGGTDLQVQQQASPNMSVLVKAGQALIPITNTNLTPSETYKVYFTNDADYTVNVTTADATNPRKDIIVARVDVSTNPNAAASNIAILECIAGTPAGSPVAPSVPANASLLATIDVPASSTSVITARITDGRTYADTPLSNVLMGLTRQGLSNMTATTTHSVADQYLATYTPPLTALVNGTTVVAMIHVNNTGAATFEPNGLPAKSIVKLGNTALAANDLKAKFPAVLTYNSTDDNWKLQNPGASQSVNANTILHAGLGRPSQPYPCSALAYMTQMGTIAFDASSNYAGASATLHNSWSHTASGTNRVVLIGFWINTSNDDVTAVTYGGNAMTRISTATVGTERCYLYGYINPSTSAQTVSVTLSSARTLEGVGASYTGAYQDFVPDASSTVTATATTTLTTNHTTVADNSWTVFFARNNFGNFSGGSATARVASRTNTIYDSNSAKTPAGLVNTLTATWGGSGNGIMAAGSIAPAKTGPDLPYLEFNQDNRQAAEFYFPLPVHYTGGTFTAKLHWATASGTGDVVWGIQARALADQDDTASAYGTAVTVTDTKVASKHHITSATGAVTIGGTPVAGQLCCVRVFRDATNASDTLTAAARLIAVELVL